jgi:Flp pilus assembly protein TadD
VYEQNGTYELAIAELQRAADLSNDNPIDLSALGHVYAVSGRREQASHTLQELRRLSAKRYVSGYDLALVYVGLGEKDKALQALDQAFREHSAWMLHLKVDPRLDPLRSDPRFQDLLRRVGLSS